MTSQMHAELAALCQLFHSGEISDEEWALLQIHMAYCDGCRRTFLQIEEIPASVNPGSAPNSQQSGLLDART
jgi:hypothetical protein